MLFLFLARYRHKKPTHVCKISRYTNCAHLVISRATASSRWGRYTLSVKLGDFTVWRHTWRKNWINCAVLTGNSAGLTTVLSSCFSHRELRSSLSEFHSFLSLPKTPRWHHLKALNSFSRWASHDIFLFKYHFLIHILRFLSSFRITLWPMWLANSKTALFLSTIVTCTRRHTELTKKLTNLMENLCGAREHSV